MTLTAPPDGTPTWGLVCRSNVERARKVALEIIEFLERNHQDLTLEEGFAAGIGKTGVPIAEMDPDIFITVGGDGTILRALHATDRPIFAVNSGAIGFLTEVEPKFATSGIKRILDGDYYIEERSRLSVMLDGQKLPDAANEVTVQSAKIAKMIKYELYLSLIHI